MQTYILSRLVRSALPVFVAVLVSADSSIAADKKAEAAKKPAAEAVATPGDATAEIEKQLATVGEVAYLDTTLADIVHDLELRYRVDIDLDTEALASEGKGAESTCSLQLKNVTLQSVLNRLLNQHGLAWTVADEGILITTKAGDEARTSAHVYSVADLADDDGNVDYEELTEMLVQSVEPDSWRSNGGAAGAIAKVSAKKSLVITQTYANQRRIAAILQQLADK